MSDCIQFLNDPMVEIASAVALVPLPVLSDSLFLEEIPDISAQPGGIDRAVFSFRQQSGYPLLPCGIGQQDGFEFTQRFMSVIPRGVRVDNIFVFVFIFYTGMGQLHGQLMGQLSGHLLWQPPRCL